MNLLITPGKATHFSGNLSKGSDMLRTLQGLTIFRELERRCSINETLASQYRGQIESSFHDLARYLTEIRRYFHHYTDHSIEHSLRIIERVGRILTPEQLRNISTTELFLLISTALVHDIGMVVSDREVLSLLKDQEFLDERKHILDHLDLIPSTGDWTFFGIERLFVSDYIRRRHGKRCEMLLKSDIQFIQQLAGGNAELTKWIGRIAAGHTLSASEIADHKLFPPNVALGYDQVNAQFLVFCLRIGDLLDITGHRACPFIRDLSEPMVALSTHHWDQYKDIEIRNLAPSQNIVIGGTCPSQEAERILREWISWLEDETERATTTLNAQPEQYRLNVGRIQYSVEPQADANGRPLYEFRNFRFNLDEEQVFKRLFGERLYGRMDVALRELLQNAIDATRVRIALECSAQTNWRAISDQERQLCFRDYARQSIKRLPIEVHLEERISEHCLGTETWLHITDHGVGMSRDIIEAYLLKAGRSRWNSDPRVKALHVGTIGEFGIGFLSTFMISERTVIDTQSILPHEDGIRATIYNWKGYLSTQPLHGCAAGTRVSLLIKREFVEHARSILKLVEYWCPFIEFMITVKNIEGEAAALVPAEPSVSNRNILRFHLPGGHSLATIEDISSTRDKPVLPSLCQDGIVVADVPPPILETPAQRILRQRGIRVDLRGPDRVRLDLSRNLTEGGSDLLWDKLTPRIWQGIVENCLESQIGRAALADYLQASFESSLGSLAFIIDPQKALHICQIEKVEWPAKIRFADALDRDLEKLLASDLETWTMLLPNVPSRMYHLGPLADENETTWYEMDEPTYYWSRKGGVLISEDAESQPHVPSRYALTRYVKYLERNFKLVCAGRNSLGELSAKTKSGGESLDSLSFWRMSPNWYAVRNPCDGKWAALHRQDLDLLEGLKEKIDLIKYVLCLFYYIWGRVETWTSEWAHTHHLEQVAGQLYEERKKALSHKWFEEDDSDEYEIYDSDEEDRLWEELEIIALEVLPRIDLRKFTDTLTDWDVEEWGKNRWSDDWRG